MTRIASLGLVALAACSGSPRTSPNAPPTSSTTATAAASAVPFVTPEELTAAPARLELAELTLNQNQKPGLLLRADGTVSLPDGRVLGRLGKDGRFTDREGRLLAELTDDGEVVDAKGDYLPVTIQGSQVKLLTENRVIELRGDGTLQGTNPSAPTVTISGLTPKARRAALFLLVLSAYPVRSGS
jgi:hypothetical protein